MVHQWILATTRLGGIEQTSITFIVLPLGQAEQVHKQATLRASACSCSHCHNVCSRLLEVLQRGIKRLLMGNKCRIHTTGPDTVKWRRQSMRRVLYVNVPYPPRRRCSTAQTLDGEYRFKAWAAAVNCRYGQAIDQCCHLRSDAPGTVTRELRGRLFNSEVNQFRKCIHLSLRSHESNITQLLLCPTFKTREIPKDTLLDYVRESNIEHTFPIICTQALQVTRGHPCKLRVPNLPPRSSSICKVDILNTFSLF